MKKSQGLKAEEAISGRILVADDDEATLDMVSEFLELMGFEVALAENGIEALSLFIADSFDIVLTDLNMPVMDGLSLAINIKRKSPKTPIVLLTGSNKEEVLKKVEKGPFYSVLFKPFRIADFRKTIQGALALI